MIFLYPDFSRFFNWRTFFRLIFLSKHKLWANSAAPNKSRKIIRAYGAIKINTQVYNQRTVSLPHPFYWPTKAVRLMLSIITDYRIFRCLLTNADVHRKYKSGWPPNVVSITIQSFSTLSRILFAFLFRPIPILKTQLWTCIY